MKVQLGEETQPTTKISKTRGHVLKMWSLKNKLKQKTLKIQDLLQDTVLALGSQFLGDEDWMTITRVIFLLSKKCFV